MTKAPTTTKAPKAKTATAGAAGDEAPPHGTLGREAQGRAQAERPPAAVAVLF